MKLLLLGDLTFYTSLTIDGAIVVGIVGMSEDNKEKVRSKSISNIFAKRAHTVQYTFVSIDIGAK